ncbi:MAG: MBG domain-containing protein [Acidimicrobiales bacterium]
MFRTIRSSAIAISAALLIAPFSVALSPASVASASPTPVLVDGSGQSGWNISQTCYDENYDAIVPTYPSDQVTFVPGPGTPPLGTGSLQLATGDGTTGATCAAALRNSNYNDVPLASLTALSYSTYDQVNNGQQFPFLELHINYGEGGQNADDSLFFEPPYQTPSTGSATCPDQGATVMDTWQTWNALTGCWWSNSGLLGNPGTGVFSLSQIIALYPSAYIVNMTDDLSGFTPVSQGGIGVVVGETGDPDQFVGNVDDFTIGTATSTTTYNFDPVPPSPTITWPAPTSISYGTALSGTQLDASASYGSNSVTGTFNYSPSLGTVLSAGPHTLSVTFTPNNSNYSVVSTTVPLTVNPAVLTVTPVNATRAFGASNPAFTYTVSGFENGDPTSIVHGSPSCTTTATTTSAYGTYPITCSAGTLSATSNYTFSFKPGVLTVGSSCLSGTFNGYTVATGASVCFGSGATINDYLNVGVGSSLDIEGAKVNGPITSLDSKIVRICGATVSGPVTLSFDTGPVIIGDGGTCASSKISSAVTLTADSGGSEVVNAAISGPLTLSGDSGGETIDGNSVASSLTVQLSSGGITVNNNTVSGPFTIESNASAVTADSNSSTQSFTIQLNTGGVTILSNSTKANFTVELNFGSINVTGNTAKGFSFVQ